MMHGVTNIKIHNTSCVFTCESLLLTCIQQRHSGWGRGMCSFPAQLSVKEALLL